MQNVQPPPLVPPFTRETAIRKARAAEDAWNSRDPDRVALAYTEDSHWRNRGEFFQGREEIRDFLSGKWAKELDYRWGCPARAWEIWMTRFGSQASWPRWNPTICGPVPLPRRGQR